MKILRFVIGVVLILFGIFALVTPLTPGALLALAIGLELLGIGFLMPKKARDLWERSSLRKWINKKLIRFGCAPLRKHGEKDPVSVSQSPHPASPSVSADTPRDSLR